MEKTSVTLRDICASFICPNWKQDSRLRKAHRLQRREYLNPGPNFCWHADGYDKLKSFGFPIHGCIDGFCRKIMWLEIVKTNNNPHVIGKLFLDCIKEQRGCPTVLRTDRGDRKRDNGFGSMFLASSSHRWPTKCKRPSLWVIPYKLTDLIKHGGPCCAVRGHLGGLTFSRI